MKKLFLLLLILALSISAVKVEEFSLNAGNGNPEQQSGIGVNTGEAFTIKIVASEGVVGARMKILLDDNLDDNFGFGGTGPEGLFLNSLGTKTSCEGVFTDRKITLMCQAVLSKPGNYIPLVLYYDENGDPLIRGIMRNKPITVVGKQVEPKKPSPVLTKPVETTVQTPSGLITEFSATPENVEAGGRVTFTVDVAKPHRDLFVAFSLRNAEKRQGLYQTFTCGTRIPEKMSTGSIACTTNVQASGDYDARVIVANGNDREEKIKQNAVKIGVKSNDVKVRPVVETPLVQKPDAAPEEVEKEEKPVTASGAKIVVKLNENTGRGIFQKTYADEVLVPSAVNQLKGIKLDVSLSKNKKTLTIKAQGQDWESRKGEFTQASTMIRMKEGNKEVETVQLAVEKDDFRPTLFDLLLPEDSDGATWELDESYKKAGDLKCKPSNAKAFTADCSTLGEITLKPLLTLEQAVGGKKTSLIVWNTRDHQVRLIPVIILGQSDFPQKKSK